MHGGDVAGFVGGNDFKSKMGNFQKKSKQVWVWGRTYLFCKKNHWIFWFVTLWIFLPKKTKLYLTCRNCAKFSDDPLSWKFQCKKPRPMEILHDSLPLSVWIFSRMGYSRKKQGGLRIWNFQGYWRNSFIEHNFVKFLGVKLYFVWNFHW